VETWVHPGSYILAQWTDIKFAINEGMCMDRTTTSCGPGDSEQAEISPPTTNHILMKLTIKIEDTSAVPLHCKPPRHRLPLLQEYPRWNSHPRRMGDDFKLSTVFAPSLQSIHRCQIVMVINVEHREQPKHLETRCWCFRDKERRVTKDPSGKKLERKCFVVSKRMSQSTETS
jgi:hypothetical protein